MYKKGDACPICGKGKLSKKIVEEIFEYKSQELVVPNYVVYACDKCSEEIVDEKEIKRTEKVIRDFHRKVDGLLTSCEIKAIRERLGKTQEEIGVMLGMGKKSFVRYENGQMTQGKPLDILLRLLDQNPALLDMLAQTQGQLSFPLEAKETKGAIIVSEYEPEAPGYEYEEEYACAA